MWLAITPATAKIIPVFEINILAVNAVHLKPLPLPEGKGCLCRRQAANNTLRCLMINGVHAVFF
jgi:hypothetical protein